MSVMYTQDWQFWVANKKNNSDKKIETESNAYKNWLKLISIRIFASEQSKILRVYIIKIFHVTNNQISICVALFIIYKNPTHFTRISDLSDSEKNYLRIDAYIIL